MYDRLRLPHMYKFRNIQQAMGKTFMPFAIVELKMHCTSAARTPHVWVIRYFAFPFYASTAPVNAWLQN